MIKGMVKIVKGMEEGENNEGKIKS